ncbi:MAG: hypothetical protein IJS15_04220 [Victivallales bacterium]|nr:hypothetical protein [Victivallales bacterium]
MSYDIMFCQQDEVCRLPFSPPRGGTYCLDDGFREAWLNITFNYASIFEKHHLSIIKRERQKSGICVLEGKTASECVRILTGVIPKMGDETVPDYWKATEGNAKKALINLLMIAVAVPPDAICRVSY